MQELVLSEMLGRVTSIGILGAQCMIPVGCLLGGVLTDRIGPGWVFITGGTLNLVLAVIALSERDIRKLA
jgi:predicted MFS family arabinose efflux permease